MTKVELEAKVNELELTLNSLELNAKTVKDDLVEANNKLESINKPEISAYNVDQIRETVDAIMRQYNFDDSDNYEYDFEIDYDGRLNLSNIDLENKDELAEAICDGIEDLFNVVVVED
tara:strand:- start:152 stop:505 length:354 start_codon:yes stop_codon:yes gene_type:complete